MSFCLTVRPYALLCSCFNKQFITVLARFLCLSVYPFFCLSHVGSQLVNKKCVKTKICVNVFYGGPLYAELTAGCASFQVERSRLPVVLGLMLSDSVRGVSEGSSWTVSVRFTCIDCRIADVSAGLAHCHRLQAIFDVFGWFIAGSFTDSLLSDLLSSCCCW